MECPNFWAMSWSKYTSRLAKALKFSRLIYFSMQDMSSVSKFWDNTGTIFNTRLAIVLIFCD